MSNKTQILAENGKQELFIIREFDGPRELVFRAFSEPDLLLQWLGPKEMETIIDKLDHKSHGNWRFSHKDPTGMLHTFNGTIHEVCDPERIIRTFEYEGMPAPGHVSLEFLNFEDMEGGRSKISIQVIYKSVEDRDSHIQSGMERGIVDSHERLDVLLKSM